MVNEHLLLNDISCSKLGVVIVTYNPEISLLVKKVKQLTSDCSNIVVVIDNSPQKISLPFISNLILKWNNNEGGIAKAQNIGAQILISLGVTHVVFFDQDSIIEEDYLNNIYYEYTRIRNKETSMGILGPIVHEIDSYLQYPLEKLSEGDSYAIVDRVISSGSIMSLDDFIKFGCMDERLFIDYVDSELCWRARSKGFKICVTYNVHLPHKIGARTYSLSFIKGIISSPIRYFYQYRNLIWLLPLGYVPFKWKIKNIIRRLLELTIIPFYMSPNQFYRNVYKAIRDGIRGLI